MVQWTAMKEMKEHFSFEKSLRELALFGLKKTQVIGDLVNVK